MFPKDNETLVKKERNDVSKRKGKESVNRTIEKKSKQTKKWLRIALAKSANRPSYLRNL